MQYVHSWHCVPLQILRHVNILCLTRNVVVIALWRIRMDHLLVLIALQVMNFQNGTTSSCEVARTQSPHAESLISHRHGLQKACMDGPSFDD